MFDRIRLNVNLCPHVRCSVNTTEDWGVAHNYVFTANCDVCGPVKHRESRRPYQG